MQSDLMSSIHPGVQQFYLRTFFTLGASNSFLFHLGGGPTCYLCWSGQLSSYPSWSNMACTIKVSKRHTILVERSAWMSEPFWLVYRFYKIKTVCSALRNFFISHVVTGPDNSLVALPKTFPSSLYISIFNLFLLPLNHHLFRLTWRHMTLNILATRRVHEVLLFHFRHDLKKDKQSDAHVLRDAQQRQHTFTGKKGRRLVVRTYKLEEYFTFNLHSLNSCR